jgi:hypothetical protein
MHILETLAERDFAKFDAVGNRPATEAFAHLCYLMDYADEQREQMQKASQNNGN